MADETTQAGGPPTEDPKCDQAFFLNLASKGKDAWNAWRRDPDNDDVRVTFAGIDFRNPPNDQINFEGFEFGDDADFSQCKWRGVGWDENGTAPIGFKPGRACFTGAAFGGDVKFNGAAFGGWALFNGADFHVRTNFSGATFDDHASFVGARFGNWGMFYAVVFGDYVSFEDASFAHSARFEGAVFGEWASFVRASFGDVSSFDGATFGRTARFDEVAFGDSPWFNGTTLGNGATFRSAFFKGQMKFAGKSVEQWAWNFLSITPDFGQDARKALAIRHKESWKRNGSGPDRFLSLSFANARFYGEAIFSGRSFEQITDFTDARFCYPPDFDAATNVGRVDFTGARIRFVPPDTLFHWTKISLVPIRLRAFRKIAEETKNHDLERDLFIEERKAERGVYLRQRLNDLKEAPEDFSKELEYIDEYEWRPPVGKWRRKEWLRITHILGFLAKIGRLLIHVFWIAIMFLYAALADNGRSFVWPAMWLIASGFFFYWRYLAVLAPLMAKASPPDMDKYKQAVRMLALGNTVPFVGPITIDSEIKKFLLCPGGNCPGPPIPPEGYQSLVLGQNLVSITLVFFIGLALRNYFRIK